MSTESVSVDLNGWGVGMGPFFMRTKSRYVEVLQSTFSRQRVEVYWTALHCPE